MGEINRIAEKPFNFESFVSNNDPIPQNTIPAPSIFEQAPVFSGNINEVFASRSGINLTRFQVANPLPPSGSNKSYDGALVGNNSRAFSGSTPLSSIPAVQPSGGRRSDETIIFVNGINTDFAGHNGNLQDIADATGQPVIGVYNATEGMFRDLLQSAGDKFDIGNNPAVRTTADAIYNELKAGNTVHLMAHSQGGLITSRALQDVQNRLRLEDGLSRREVQNLMNNIKVETFGSAASVYPDGPRYVHYVNNKDLVPGLFGLGRGVNIPWGLRLAAYANPATSGIMAFIDTVGFLAKPGIHPGEGAQINYFTQNGNGGGLNGYFEGTHNFDSVYLSRRVPFEQAIRGDFNR